MSSKAKRSWSAMSTELAASRSVLVGSMGFKVKLKVVSHDVVVTKDLK